MIRVIHPGTGSRIRVFLPIPDPEVKKAPDPGSGTLHLMLIWIQVGSRLFMDKQSKDLIRAKGVGTLTDPSVPGGPPKDFFRRSSEMASISVTISDSKNSEILNLGFILSN
jgi:hypothetical protein